MKRKVVIIGAGVGGLATAVRLLSKGYEVTIYEKESSVGGRVNLLRKEGFSFDLTASILLLPQEFKEIFGWAGRDYKDYLNFINIDPLYRVHDFDHHTFDLYSDVAKTIQSLESLSFHDSTGYLSFLAAGYKKYLIANKNFLQKSYYHTTDFINPKSIINGYKLKTLSASYDFISKYISNQKLRELISFQSLLVGISPFDGPNIYTILPCVSQLYGLWYLQGGMYSYIKTLERLIYELGGSILVNNPVEEIITSNGRALGVKVESEIIKSDIVVCNADFPYSMENLIRDKESKGQYTYDKLTNMKYSCSTFILYLGLKKRYPQLTVHNLYLGQHFKESTQQAFTGLLPHDPVLYMYCPSAIDESVAPSGMESLSVIVRVPNLSFDSIQWNENTIRSYRLQILNQLSKIQGLEDIKEHIIFEDYLTPLDLSTRFNSYYGTGFGLSPTLMQSNYFRPHIKSDSVENLYFVGSSVHPGTGISLVLISSKLVAQEILKEG